MAKNFNDIGTQDYVGRGARTSKTATVELNKKHSSTNGWLGFDEEKPKIEVTQEYKQTVVDVELSSKQEDLIQQQDPSVQIEKGPISEERDEDKQKIVSIRDMVSNSAQSTASTNITQSSGANNTQRSHLPFSSKFPQKSGRVIRANVFGDDSARRSHVQQSPSEDYTSKYVSATRYPPAFPAPKKHVGRKKEKRPNRSASGYLTGNSIVSELFNADKPKLEQRVHNIGPEQPIIKQQVVKRTTVSINERMTIMGFAKAISRSVNLILNEIMLLGVECEADSPIDFDIAEIIGDRFDYDVVIENSKSSIAKVPVVALMGHIDHGKTTLFDAISGTSIVAREEGGITQVIRASQIDHSGRIVSFIDTPGHAAFSAMRSSGAKVADVIVIVISAADGVQDQTIDSIKCAKSAGVPIIIAVTKMDLLGANPRNVYTGLSRYDVIVDKIGGDIPTAEVSGLSKMGLDKLLDMILSMADAQNMRVHINRTAVGIMIETMLSKGIGITGVVILENGSLSVGDQAVVNDIKFKVRTIRDINNNQIAKALPGMPVIISGFDKIPESGSIMRSVHNESESDYWMNKFISNKRAKIASLAAPDSKTINVIIKADSSGSTEAVRTAIERLKVKDINIEIILCQVGDLTENDCLFAKRSNAIVFCFKVNISAPARLEIKNSNILVKNHKIIYHLLDDLMTIIEEKLGYENIEQIVGTATVKAIFEIKNKLVIGCDVNDGVMLVKEKVRIFRKEEKIHESSIRSLQRNRAVVKEVKAGMESGILMDDEYAAEIGDKIQCYTVTNVKVKPVIISQ